MIGAIAGDVIGSVHEHAGTKRTDFPLFTEESRWTDDTVLTIATAEALLAGIPYDRAYRDWARRHPYAGYGGAFKRWFRDAAAGPYNSWGNGSAMRVSPVAFGFDTAESVLAEAERSAAVTHDHPEGIRGAQAAALATFLARQRIPRPDIRAELMRRFGYALDRTLDAIRPAYAFDVSCQGSVPEALIAFLETPDALSAIRGAISLGGDADTQAAIAGAAAVAWDGRLPAAVDAEVRRRLTPAMREVVEAFEARYGGIRLPVTEG